MKKPSCKVVSLNDYRPKITVEQLLADVSTMRISKKSPLADTILLLPDIFEQALHLILEDFDYPSNPKSHTATACRLLAAGHNYFEEKLQEVRA